MSAGGRPDDLKWLAAAAGATVLLTVAAVLAAPADTSPVVDGSSYAAHPRGARAAYLALAEAGYRVERSFEPLVDLDRQDNVAVLVIADPQAPPSRQDRRALERFVSRGGVLLAAGDRSAAFLPELPFIGSPGERPRTETMARASLLSPLSRGVPEVRMAPPRASLQRDTAFLPVYGDDRTPYVAAARVGDGTVLWWSDAAPLSNGGLSEPGHAELLANALGPPSAGRRVLWDEHYHGYTRSLWSYLAGTPVPYAALQAALVFAAFLFAFARRRGPVRAPHVEPRVSPLEFVESMGALYERAGAAAGALATVRARARRIMTAAAGLPSSAPDERLGRAAAERSGLEGRELVDLLARSRAAAHDPRLTPAAASALVAALQAAAARLQAVRPRPPRPGPR